jgi:endonuclease-3
MKLFPRDQWTLLSHWLIWHGRRRCFARRPDCEHCELLDVCPTGPEYLQALPQSS